MAQDKICKDCSYRINCGEVYEKLGKCKSRSVTCEAVAAFLAPMIVFIAALCSSQYFFAAAGEQSQSMSVLSLGAAAIPAFGAALCGRIVLNLFDNGR